LKAAVQAVYRIKRFAIFVFAAGVILSGSVMLAEMLQLWRDTADWRSAEATIRNFETQRMPGRRDLVQYELRYEFLVAGQGYSGEWISPTTTNGQLTRRESRHYRRYLRPGKVVPVIYDPEQPGAGSFVEPVLIADVIVAPGGLVLLGLWILYLLRKTRERKVPERLGQQLEDADSPRWHSIYQTVLEKERVELYGKAWYARSGSLTHWPHSRVALVATPNTIAVIRGPYTANGILAAALTSLLEFFLSSFVALIHAGSFAMDWYQRHKTWKHLLRQGRAATVETLASYTAEIVSIDETAIHGYDPRKHELWFRLPTRPVDDCIRLAPELIQEIEQFIGYVRLMQQALGVATDEAVRDEAVLDETVVDGAVMDHIVIDDPASSPAASAAPDITSRRPPDRQESRFRPPRAKRRNSND
jgi:hypothetical protein